MVKKKKGVLLEKIRFGDGKVYWAVEVEGKKRPQIYMEEGMRIYLPPDLPGKYVGKTVRLFRKGAMVDVYIYRHGYGNYYNGRWKDGMGKFWAEIVTIDELKEAEKA